ncbi:hypothetical protein QUB68_24790 [Microcoleus sp. A006_D1]|uniref:hypothetical protein n=1 Tax=Microcoleus sp. A006_D1 TaxID=3055267 RepID=UPI002FD53CA8
MTIYINQEDLYERTQDFLSTVNYPNVHMTWGQWCEQAETYGLDATEIAELEQHLESSNQLTRPVRFAGRQWWLTKQEIEHVELLKVCFPVGWETEVEKRMQRRELGYSNRDVALKGKKKAKHSVHQ